MLRISKQGIELVVAQMIETFSNRCQQLIKGEFRKGLLGVDQFADELIGSSAKRASLILGSAKVLFV